MNTIKKCLHFLKKQDNHNGASAILVAIAILFIILPFGALAVDLGHFYVVRTELQNAADAGALAGALNLYLDDGSAVNPSANQKAYNAAIQNKSDKILVDIDWTPGENIGSDIERGHWSMGIGDNTKGFEANDSTIAIDLWDYIDAPGEDTKLKELDGMETFINAVRVITRRDETIGTGAISFFGRIFGIDSFDLSAEAVAYIGFIGNTNESEVELPLGICEQAVRGVNGDWCTVGQMVPAGNVSDINTGAWTNLEQPDPCTGGANASDLKDLVPDDCIFPGNSRTLTGNAGTQLINGEVQDAYKTLYDCWEDRTNGGTEPWKVTLPVVWCRDDGNVAPCMPFRGAVSVYIMYMGPKSEGGPDQLIPTTYAAFNDFTVWDKTTDCDCNPEDHEGDDQWDVDECVWESFATHYMLGEIEKDEQGNIINFTPLSYGQKAVYLFGDCEYTEAGKGETGGPNFGILARIPRLVK